MKTNLPKTNRKIWLNAAISLAVFVLFAPGASAQTWTAPDSSNNISNLNTGGNVGIGTTTPATPLHVVGDATFSNNIAINGATLKSWSSGKAIQGTTGGFFLGNGGDTHVISNAYNPANWKYMGNGTAANMYMYQGDTVFRNAVSGSADANLSWTNRMIIKANGNVGIGTTAPANLLTVIPSSATAAATKTSYALGVGYTTFGVDATLGSDSGYAYLQSWNTKPLQINNQGNDTIINLNDGNVGIGITPQSKLDVNGFIRSRQDGFMFPNGSVQSVAAFGTITSVTGGQGLTGSGTSAVTLNIGAGTGLSVAADSISVNYGAIDGTAVEGSKTITAAGDGMSAGPSVTLGAGGTLTLNNIDKGSTQSIFKNVKDLQGTIQFSATSNNDAITFAGGGGTTVSFEQTQTTKKITIDGSTSTPSAGNISAGQFGQNTGGGNYTFPGNVTVNGNIAAKYQDVAEWVTSSEQIPTGTVVVLDSTKSNQVIASTQAYDTRVAGVISAQPGIALGEGGDDKVLVATTGRVLVEVDASRGPIHIGDLLVTSDVRGIAMRSEPVNVGGVPLHRPGTLIGKALEPLEKGKGKILVLLSLQ